jgi:hypothetical protein
MLGMTTFAAQNILVNSGKETYIEIAMTEMVTALDDVVVKVKAEKDQPLNKMATSSARMLSSEEANRYAGSWGDPARMASGFAGVLMADDTRNDIVIRGNSSVGLLWRLDGYEIFNPNHFGASGATGGSITMLNNNQLANSDFYTGAFPAEFGSATAGVFDLRLRNGNNQKHEFLAAISYNGMEAGAEGPIGSGGASYMINARYSFTQFAFSDVMVGVFPVYQDLCAKVNVPTKHGNFSMITLFGHSTLKISTDDFTDDHDWKDGDYGREINMENLQYFFGANYTHRFAANTRLENRLSYQAFNGKTTIDAMKFPNADAKFPYTYMTDREATLTIAPTLHHRISSRNIVQAGAAADIYMTSFDDKYYGIPSGDPTLYDNAQPREIYTDGSSHNAALVKCYVQWQRRFSDDLSLTAGLHGDFYTFSKEAAAEPRLGMKWSLSERWSLNAAAGLHSKIQPAQVYFYSPQSGVYPNQNLRSTKSWHSVIGGGFKHKNFRIKGEAYFQYLYHVPVRADAPAQSIINLADDYFHDWNYAFENEGKGSNYGVELTVERFFSNGYYFLVTASLYNSLYTGMDGVWRNTRFNGNYAANLLGGYEWKVSGRHLLGINVKASYLGNKRILPTKRDGANQAAQYDYEDAYEEQLPAYFRMDVDLAFKLNYSGWALECFVGAWNVTDHQNIFSQEYNVSRDKMETAYQQGFMPMGGIKCFF